MARLLRTVLAAGYPVSGYKSAVAFTFLNWRPMGPHGAEEFQVLFPPERNEEVTKLLSQPFQPELAG
jgi:hypothetical protein